MTYKTRVVLFLPHLGVALGAVIHLHAIRRLFVSVNPGNAFTPDVDAVSCQAVFLIYRQLFIVGKVAVTGIAAKFPHIDVRNVGKIHAVGLP